MATPPAAVPHPWWSAVRRLAFAGALAAGAAASTARCTAAHTPAEERAARAAGPTGDIVVGVVWPWNALRDVRYGDGLELAADEVNARGGIHGRRVRLQREDDHGSVDEGRMIAQRLGGDPNVAAVIGHLQSYVTIPAASIYDAAGMLLIAPAATDPQLTARGYPLVFRTTFTDKVVGQQMADVAVKAGYRRVAIYYMRNTYGRGLSNAFEEHAGAGGINIIARQSYDPSEQVSEQTFGATLRDWKQLAPDALFIAGEVPSAGILIAAARHQGLTMPILGGDAMATPALVSIAGAAAEGTTVASAFHPDEPRAEVRAFNAAFTKRFGAPPDAGAALGYDALRVLTQAMERAPTTAPENVARALHALSGWPGVTGRFSFDAAGDPTGIGAVTVVVRHGRFVYVGADTARSIASVSRAEVP